MQICFTSTEEDQSEPHDQGTIDDILGHQDVGEVMDATTAADEEAELLEQKPLLGHPATEKERSTSWLRLPRSARVASRRRRRNLRHLPKEALIHMLRAARAPQDYINAAKPFRCQGYDNTKQRPQTHQVSPPRPCALNHEVGIEVFGVLEATVCMGTTYDQA